MTEQMYFRSFFTRFWLVWLSVLIVGLIAGYIVTKELKPSYEGSVAFTIHRTPDQTQDSGNFYRYDGYYSQQAMSLERNNLVTWLHSSKTVYDIYSNAGLQSLAQQSASNLARFFTIPDTISPEADVTLLAKTNDQATQLSRSLVDYTEKNYHTTGYQLTASDPLIVPVTPSKGLIIGASALAFLIIGFVVTLLIHYFTPTREK